MRHRRIIAVLALVLAICAVSGAQNETRRALVIGNSAYEYFDPLSNPANDADDMGRALEAVGFWVTTLIDAGYQEMDEAVYEFGRSLATEGGVGLFYYAGHGIEVGGTNYLIPVDALIRAEDEVRFRSVPVDQVLVKMESARNGTNIVILDACRDNPLPASARSAGSSRGLSVVAAPTGSLVVYATAPGQIAQDGDGRNGVFTGALLSHIATPGVDVMEMLRAVRRDVIAATGGDQTPWENSSLTGAFYFAGSATASAPVRPTPPPSLQPTVGVAGTTAQLYIESQPMGAVASIDGAERGTTPLFVEDLPVGRSVLIEVRQGTMSARQELRPNEAELYQVSLTLSQEMGNLVLLTVERGLEIRIDGEHVGVLEGGVLQDLPAGSRTIELSGSGLYYRSQVEIPTDATAQIRPDFVEVGSIVYDLPLGAHAALTGPDAEVQTLRGSGNLENVVTGEYRVRITAMESADEEQSLRLSRSATELVAPRRGALRILSSPSGAAVTIGGRDRGQTPLTLEDLSLGRVSYRLTLEGYRPTERTITVVAGRTVVQSEMLVRPGPGRLDTVFVEGGTFRMGPPSGGAHDERPAHSVTLDSFWMTETEVTFAQYDAFAQATGRDLPAEQRLGLGTSPVINVIWSGKVANANRLAGASPEAVPPEPPDDLPDDEGWGRGTRPVINVSWYDAVEYANWLSGQDGLEQAYRISGTTVTWDRGANGWRLPSEAEWEYAARGGTRARETTYAGSNTVGEVAWYTDNGGWMTHPVREKRANELGLYDMSGNVWEWCWDWSGSYGSQSQSNPAGPASGSGRVLRGGSWSSTAVGTGVVNRNGITPVGGDSRVGFRLVAPAVQ